jgi:ABC-type sugar transport system ATPase subunit
VKRCFADLTREAIVRLMAGRETKERFRRPRTPGRRTPAGRGLSRCPAAGSAAAFSSKTSRFTLRRGEVLGVFGLVGAGRTELLETLFGLHAGRATGRFTLAGKPIALASPAAAIAAGLALAPEDRKRDGLVLPMSVAANASLASLDRTLAPASPSESRREAAHLHALHRSLPRQDASLAQLHGQSLRWQPAEGDPRQVARDRPEDPPAR